MSTSRKPAFRSPVFFILTAIFFVLAVGLACNTPTADDDTSRTQIALNIQATQAAIEQTQAAQNQAQAQQVEEAEEAEPDYQTTTDAQATQMAANVQSTVNAQQVTQAAQATATSRPTDTQQAAPPPTTQAPPPTQQSTGPEEDFETWMRSASILLFEDMAGDFNVPRLINQALERMGLSYVDVKDAMGNYKTQILSNGPGGRGWDLIISGKERKDNISGEFYVYLNDSLNMGSSLIIEEWDIDDIASGKIGSILSRCGVEFHRDWIDEPLDRQLLYPINGDHPIHHEPNEGISLTNPTNYWTWNVFDLGDLLQLRPGSDAIPLWGARTISNTSYLTAVTCLDGRLTIQTYSTHSYGDNRVIMMWQNYIYNALKARYDYLSSQ